jgi:Rhodanese-related sulfurtransferase
MSGSYLDETDISAARAIAVVATGEAWLLDVREKSEWDAGHAPGAHHIPMYDLAERQHELPDDEQIVVICHLGERSAVVRDALVAADYRAANIVGGMDAWQLSGGPVTRGGHAGGADGIMEEGGA